MSPKSPQISGIKKHYVFFNLKLNQKKFYAYLVFTIFKILKSSSSSAVWKLTFPLTRFPYHDDITRFDGSVHNSTENLNLVSMIDQVL